MNEQMQQVLTELCTKLGTTAEHLWTVLIRQSYISGITNIVVICVWYWFCVLGFRFIKRKTTCPPETKEDPYPSADLEDEIAAAAWFVLALVVAMSTLIILCEAQSIIGSLFNPEYWALTQIVH